MTTRSRTSSKRGGVADINYPFMLNPAVAQAAMAATPNITGGRRTKTKKAGCTSCASNSLRGGASLPAGVELTPFISALALLGARMLADKSPTLNMSNILGSKKPSSARKSKSLSTSLGASASKSRPRTAKY
jgi:hypothetical protein